MDGPKTLMEVREMFKTEDDCRKALFDHRWPEGFSCPRCSHPKAWAIKSRPLHECAACGYQVSATAGTIFHKNRVGLKEWFLAIYLLASTKKPLSAAELARQLGIAPQTAWTMRHKVSCAPWPGERASSCWAASWRWTSPTWAAGAPAPGDGDLRARPRLPSSPGIAAAAGFPLPTCRSLKT